MARKEVQGEIRNKQNTQQKLLKGVEDLLLAQGHQALTISGIAQISGVDKKMIYVYYESIDGLLSAYLDNFNFFTIDQEKANMLSLYGILLSEVNNFYKNKVFQKILLWEISGSDMHAKTINKKREAAVSEKKQYISDKYGEKAATAYVQLYTSFALYILHAHSATGVLTGMDYSKKKDKEVLLLSAENILSLFADKSTEKKKKKKKK